MIRLILLLNSFLNTNSLKEKEEISFKKNTESKQTTLFIGPLATLTGLPLLIKKNKDKNIIKNEPKKEIVEKENTSKQKMVKTEIKKNFPIIEKGKKGKKIEINNFNGVVKEIEMQEIKINKIEKSVPEIFEVEKSVSQEMNEKQDFSSGFDFIENKEPSFNGVLEEKVVEEKKTEMKQEIEQNVSEIFEVEKSVSEFEVINEEKNHNEETSVFQEMNEKKGFSNEFDFIENKEPSFNEIEPSFNEIEPTFNEIEKIEFKEDTEKEDFSEILDLISGNLEEQKNFKEKLQEVELKIKRKDIFSITITDEVRDIFLDIQRKFKQLKNSDLQNIINSIFYLKTKNYISNKEKTEIKVNDDDPKKMFLENKSHLYNIFYFIRKLVQVDHKKNKDEFDAIVKNIYFTFISPSASASKDGKRIYESFNEVQDNNPEYFPEAMRDLIGNQIFDVVEKIDFLKKYSEDIVEEQNEEIKALMEKMFTCLQKNLLKIKNNEKFNGINGQKKQQDIIYNMLVGLLHFLTKEGVYFFDFNDLKFKETFLQRDIVNLRSLLKTKFSFLKIGKRNDTILMPEIEGRDCSKIFQLFFDFKIIMSSVASHDTLCGVGTFFSHYVFDNYKFNTYTNPDIKYESKSNTKEFKELYQFIGKNICEEMDEIIGYMEEFIQLTDKYYE